MLTQSFKFKNFKDVNAWCAACCNVVVCPCYNRCVSGAGGRMGCYPTAHQHDTIAADAVPVAYYCTARNQLVVFTNLYNFTPFCPEINKSGP